MSKKTQLLKYLIYFAKKIFCILTIKEDKTCILPYKKLKSKIIINIITKIMVTTTKRVVLSNYLEKIEKLENSFTKNGIYIHKGNILTKHLLYNFIDYISKAIKQEAYMQEVFILINNTNRLDKNNIIYLAKQFKRLNVVTKNINSFKKLETYLEEELGIAITITNNKRKSLLKAKIIVNIDFDEEMLNSFNINNKAIIIQMNHIQVRSKLFSGINILDYEITYKKDIFSERMYNKFNKKILYESLIYSKNYDSIVKKIQEDDVKIINLIGKNGVINEAEYKYYC